MQTQSKGLLCCRCRWSWHRMKHRVYIDFCTNVFWCIQLIVLTEIQLVALLGRLHFLSDWQHPNFKNDKGKIKNVFTALHCLLWLHIWLLWESTSCLDKKHCNWALIAVITAAHQQEWKQRLLMAHNNAALITLTDHVSFLIILDG